MYKIIYVLIVVFFGLNLRLNAQEKNKDLHFIADSLVEMGIQNKAFPGAQLLIYKKDSLQSGRALTVVEDDPYYQMISNAWGEALKTSLSQLPNFALDGN
mgnify:CR=1 FL=1